MSKLTDYLNTLPRGTRPWDAWKTRELYLRRLLDDDQYSEQEKNRLIGHYIGQEPENVDVSNTVAGYLDRTAAMTKNSAMIGVNQLRQYFNEQEYFGERDVEDAKAAREQVTKYRGLQESIPRDEGALGVAQDVVSSLPSLIENLAASVTAGYAGAKVGTAIGTMIAPGAGSAIGAATGFVSGILAGLGVNAAMEASSAFDDNSRNEEIRKRLVNKYGDNKDLVDQAQRAIALEAAEAVMVGNVFDPTNIAVAMANTKGGQLFKGFLLGKAGIKPNKFRNKLRVTKDTIGGVAQEAVQESYQDALQQSQTLYQIAKLDAEADPDSQKVPDILDVVKDIDYGQTAYAGLVGGIAGGGFSGLRSAGGKFADRKREKIRQEIRDAIDSGDLDRFNDTRNFYPIDSAERVVIEQEIKDVREGIHVDHRVDKDLTRYDMRNQLANAMAEGEKAFDSFIRKNRSNPLFSDVVNDYFDKLRSAQATAQSQAEIDRIRNQVLIGYNPGEFSLEDLKFREGEGGITDLDEARKVTPGDPSGRFGGNQGIVVDQAYTPPEFAQRTPRERGQRQLEDFTIPLSQRQQARAQEEKATIDLDKATKSQLISYINDDKVSKGLEITGEDTRSLMKLRKSKLKEMAKSIEAQNTTPTTDTQETTASTQEQVDENVETSQREPEPAPVQTEEEKQQIEELREQFLTEYNESDSQFRRRDRDVKGNPFKEISLRKGDEEQVYTREDLNELGYLTDTGEIIDAKIQNDLKERFPEPEQTLDQGDQQTDTKQQPEEQSAEPEEGDTTAQTEDVDTETTVEAEQDQAEPSLTQDDITDFISILRPDPNTYIVDARKTQDGTDLDAVEVAVFNDQTQEYDQYEIDSIKARALGIVNQENEIDEQAVADYASRSTEPETAQGDTQATRTETEDAEGVTVVPVQSSVLPRQADIDEDVEPETRDQRARTENNVAYINESGSAVVNEALGIKNSQQRASLAKMSNDLNLQELEDLDGIIFTKSKGKKKDQFRYKKGDLESGKNEKGNNITVSKSLVNRLKEYADQNDIRVTVIDDDAPLPTLGAEYKTGNYRTAVAQTFAKTFGSLSGEQFISKTDPQGPKIFSVKPGETPVAGESVQQTGGSDSPMADIIGLVASQGIRDGYVAPAETEGEFVVNLFLDEEQDVTGVQGPAIKAIRIPIKGVSESNLVDFVETLKNPESKTEVRRESPLFSIAPSSEVGSGRYDRTVVDEAVAQFTREYRGGALLNYKVYDTPEQAQAETGIEFNANARGALVGDQVYLFAKNLRDLQTARKVIFHESIGHYGIRNVLGDDDFNSFLDRVIAERKVDVDAKAKKLLKAKVIKQIDNDGLRLAAEELVAEAAEGRANKSFIDKVIEIISDFLSKHFGRVQPDEIRSMILKAERAFKTGELYFGADRSAYGDFFNAQYSLGIVMDKGQVPTELQRALNYVGRELAIDGNLDTWERLRDTYSKAIEQRDMNVQDKIRDLLNKATYLSIRKASENGGYYVLPDGVWRFHVNDFDNDGNLLWDFKTLPKDWITGARDNDFAFDNLFESEQKIVELAQQGLIKYNKAEPHPRFEQYPQDVIAIRLSDFVGHKELERLYPDLFESAEIVFKMPTSRPVKFLGTPALETRLGSAGSAKSKFAEDGREVITFEINAESNITDVMSTLVHELTHGFQTVGNTAIGGSSAVDYEGLRVSTYSDILRAVNESFGALTPEERTSLIDYIKQLEANTESPRYQRKAIFKTQVGEEIRLRTGRSFALDQEVATSLWNIYNTFTGDKTDKSAFWFYQWASKNKAIARARFGQDSDEHNRAKDVHRLLANTFNRGNRSIFDRRSLLQARSENPMRSMENYQSLLGEVEARHHQNQFRQSIIALREGDMDTFRKTKDAGALALGRRLRIKFSPDEELQMLGEQSQLVDQPIFKIEDMLVKYPGPNKSNPSREEQIRYSIAENEDVPIRSERESGSAPTWMSPEEKAVWMKFGDPHAGKSIGEKFGKWRENWWTKVRQGMFDKFAPLKNLSPKSYILARMSRSTDGPFSAMFSLGHIFMDEDGAIDVDTSKKSFVESMRPLGQDLETFLRWVASNRAYDLKKAPKSRDALQFLNDDEIRIGMNFNRGTTINAVTGQKVSRKKLFDDVLKDFQAVQSSILDLSVKAGAVSKKDADIWRNQFYVPFYRVFDEAPTRRNGPATLDSLVGQDAVKRLRGSDRGLADLLHNTLMNYHHLIDVSMKNKAATQSIRDLEKIGGATRVSKKGFPLKEEDRQEFVQEINDADEELEFIAGPDAGQTVYIREDGKRAYYRINDPFVLEALMSMNSIEKDNPIYKVLRTSKRWFTYAVTADPDFKVANLIRDSIGSIAVAPLGYNPLANVKRGWKGTQKDSKTYAKLVAGGGSFIFGNVSGTDPTSEGARRLIESGVKSEFIIDSPDKLSGLERMMKTGWNLARGAWGKYEDVGTRLENVNRAALYERLTDPNRRDKDGNRIAPLSHLEASYEARDLMDFSNTGSWGMIQYIAQWSPFLNARLQGAYKLGRGAVSENQRVQFATTMLAYTMAALGLYLTHMDDEDFKEREEWDRDTYHWFKIPGFEQAIRIPKAFEVGTVTTMAERMLEQVIDEEATGKLFAERMLFALTNTFAMDLRPQLLRPIIDIYSNKNPFTDRAIESLSMKNLNIEEKRNAYTSETATLLSRINADTIGWDAVNLSPVQIEYAVQGMFAWVGTSVLAASDSIVRMINGKEPPDNGFNSIPFVPSGVGEIVGSSVRRFFPDMDSPKRSTKYTTQFYEQLKEMNQTFSTIRELRQLGDIERAMELEKEERVLLQYRTSYNRIQRRISKLRTQMQRIANDPNMDGDLKQMRIDRMQALINANIKVLQRRTNQRLAEAS